MDKITTAWVAGLLEGEGCFHLERNRYPRISLQMADEDVVRKLQAATGFGSVNGPYKTHGKAHKPHWKPAWRWLVFHREEVTQILKAVRPFMGVRRQAKIDECLNHVYVPKVREYVRKENCYRGHPLSGDNLYVSPKGKRRCQACAVLNTGYRLSRLEVS